MSPPARRAAFESEARWRAACVQARGPDRGLVLHTTGIESRRPSPFAPEQIAIPVDGEQKAVLELEQRSPPELLARFGRAQVLALDLVGRLISHVRLEVGSHQPEDLVG